jgi:hypothetical protein
MKLLNYLGLYKCDICNKYTFLPTKKNVCDVCNRDFTIKIRALFLILAEKDILKKREIFNFKFYNLLKELKYVGNIPLIEQEIFKVFQLEDDDIKDLYKLVKYSDDSNDYFDFLVISSYKGIED